MAQSVLVYNRIAQNRRQTFLLVAVAILSLVPFLAAASYGVTQLVVFRFTPYPQTSPARQEALRKALPADRRDVFEADLNRRLEVQRRAREAYEVEEGKTRAHVMTLVAVVLIATLCVVFWELGSSPTSRLLTLYAAHPAGLPEMPAKRLLENLAIGAGLPAPRLYIIDSPIPNAFAVGIDPHRSTVAVTQGLLDLLDRRELEGVLAHELSHIGNRDTRLNTVLAAVGLVVRMPDVRRRNSQPASLQPTTPPNSLIWRYRVCAILACPVFLYIFVLAPVLMAVIRAAISRGREFLADADAALLTRYPEGLLRALAKIQGAGSEVSRSNPAFSHLFFADPSSASVGIGLFTGKLLATHPPIQERIARLAEYGGGVQPSVIEKAMQAGEAFGRARAGTAEPQPNSAFVPPGAAPAQPASAFGLTGRHLGVAAVFGAAVFVGVLLLLKFAGE